LLEPHLRESRTPAKRFDHGLDRELGSHLASLVASQAISYRPANRWAKLKKIVAILVQLTAAPFRQRGRVEQTLSADFYDFLREHATSLDLIRFRNFHRHRYTSGPRPPDAFRC